MISHVVGNCIFEAGEDLLNESKTQILIFRCTTKTLDLSAPRSLLSYCMEYCGMTGLSYSTLRFLNAGRDVKPETVINDNVHLTVTHKAEFAIEPPNSLKSSMKSMLMTGLYSDINLKLNSKGDIIKAHRCILYMRSKPLREKIDKLEVKKSETPTIDLSDQLHDSEPTRQAFVSMINFLYSGEIEFPKCPIEVISILKLAKEYCIEDLEEICEDDIVKKLDHLNALEIMLTFERDIKVSEETGYRVRSFFLKNFEQISTAIPDIEEQLAKVGGLTKKLFLHISGKKKFRRKVTFMDFDINADSHEI